MGARIRRWSLWGLASLLVLVALGPWIISQAAVLNAVVNLATNSRGTTVHVESASVGWFHPLDVHVVKVDQAKTGHKFEIGRVTLERSLLSLLWNRPDLGGIVVNEPTADLVVGEKGPDEPPTEPATTAGPAPRFRLEVRDARVILRAERNADPVLDLGPISLDIKTRDDPQGLVLAADACTLIQRRVLTTEDCRRGLELIAPILGSAASVDGELSLELDQLRVPYGDDAQARFPREALVEGRLKLHHVSAGTGNPVLQKVASIAGRFLGQDVAQKVKLADEADIAFRLSEGRFHHEGLSFGLPDLGTDVQIHSQGSVGLDRTLDLELSIPLPARLLLDRPFLRQLSEKPLRLQVTGTLDEPQVALAENQNWVGELVRRFGAPRSGGAPASDTPTDAAGGTSGEQPDSAAVSPADPLLSTLSDLLGRRRERREPSAPPVTPDSADAAPPGESREGLLKKWRDQRRKAVQPAAPKKAEF